MNTSAVIKEFGFLKQHSAIVLGVVIASSLAALLEGVGIAALFPILNNLSGPDKASEYVPVFFRSTHDFFSTMPMSLKLQWAAGLMFIATVFRGLCIWINLSLSAKLRIIVIKYFRMRCAKQLMNVGMSYFNKQRAPDLQLITDSYTNSTAGTAVNMIVTACPVFLTSILLFGFLLALSWKLTLVALFLVTVVALSINFFSRQLMSLSQELIKLGYRFNQIVFDLIQGMKLIRVFSREKHMTDRFEGRVDDFNALDYKITRLSGFVPVLFEVGGIGVLALIIMVGSFVLPWQTGQIGVLLTFIVVLARIIAPVKILLQTRAALIPKIPAFKELIEFLSMQDKHYLVSGTKEFSHLKQKISFQNVEFKYNDEQSNVLNGFNLDIPQGIRMGLVGASGSGKTTTIDLLFRFYDPMQGSILIDGINLKEYDISSWRKRMGIVSQDTFLFNDTIRNNIAFGREVSQDQIIQAAKNAHIHDFISSLPKGYDSQIGDQGILLSGGQRQRLAIARAIVTDPDILILDEATSALDTETERNIQQTIDTLASGKTVIAIAHRLSTLSKFDLIAVIEAGKVVEVGFPEDLLHKDGLFAKLVAQQAIFI